MSADINPFRAGVYNDVQMYHQTADDRVRAVASFDRAECEAALQLPNLQKTVVTAVQHRLRSLAKVVAQRPVAHEVKKQQYLDYIAKLEAAGKPVTNYVCPECQGAIKTQAAPDGQGWDTLSSCPHCDELHLKFTEGATAWAVPAWAVRLPTA